MNRNDFISMIEDSIPVNRRMLGEVYELIDIFPYFQSAHMLVLKGLQTNADVKLENQLRLSSIHIADREVLYYLLNAKSTKKTESDDAIHQESKAEDKATGTQQNVIESAKNSNELISEIEKDSDEAITPAFQDIDNPVQGHSVLISSDPDSDESSGVVLLLDEDNPDSEDNIFFMDPGFSLPDYSDLLELDLEELDPELSDDVVLFEDESDSSLRNSGIPDQSDLIDKFIFSNPRIEPIKDKSDLPLEDISKPFIEQEGGFVTETLARIYITQGYYSRAIDIYEKLSLKFPEKSSYFASQIEKVKEFIKK